MQIKPTKKHKNLFFASFNYATQPIRMIVLWALIFSGRWRKIRKILFEAFSDLFHGQCYGLFWILSIEFINQKIYGVGDIIFIYNSFFDEILEQKTLAGHKAREGLG